MAVSQVVKSLLKAQGMSLVLVASGLLLTGCGAGSADTNAGTEEPASTNPDTGSDTGEQPAAHQLSLNAQPSSTTIFEGQNQTFSLSVSHNYPITVRWFRNGSQVGTGSSYTVSNATTASAGTYSCSVSDGELTVNCNSFSLAVNQIVRITTQPSNQMVNEGVDVDLSVVATGTGPLSYQWHFNGQAISGATSANLNLTDVSVDDDGNYYCVVTNAGSSATTTTANVDVAPTVAAIGRAQISWSRPTTRSDGTNLDASHIASYTLYHADSADGALEPLVELQPSELSVLVEDLTAGTHYFAMTTEDTTGLESAMSTRFSVTIQN